MPANAEPGRVDPRAESEPTRAPLSEREVEILRLVASGASNKEIATRLTISPNTVKVHVRNIFGKIGLQSRTEAALFAIQHGYVEVPGVAQPVIVEEPDSDAADSVPAATPPEPRRTNWVTPVILVAALAVFVLAGWRLLGVGTPTATAVPTPRAPERWGTLATLPQPVSGPAVAVYESDITVIGGETASGPSAAVVRFNAAADSWSAGADKPTAVADVQAAMIGGKIFVPGGRSGDGQPVRVLEIYNPRTDSWERGADLPVARSGYALVALDGKLLLFGGWDGARYSAAVFEYTPEDDAWSERAAMPTARGFAAAAVVAGRVFVIGGATSSGPVAVTEAYSPEADTAQGNGWETLAPMPASGDHVNAAVVADTILVFGGGLDDADAIHVGYNATDDAWVRLDAPAGDSTFPTEAGVVALGPLVHLIGGRQGDAPLASHVTYQAIYVSFIPFVESGDR